MPLVRTGAFLSLLLLLGTNVHAGEIEKVELRKCEAQLAAEPAAEKSSKCFADLAKKDGLAAMAAHRLEKHLARHPGLPWPSFYLGNLYWTGKPQAEDRYRVAADLFARLGDARGEVKARNSLCALLLAWKRPEEEAFEEVRLGGAAYRSKDPLLIAIAQVREAESLLRSGKNLDRAHQLLSDSRRIVFSDGEPRLQRDWLYASGNVNLEIGRTEDALKDFRDLARRFPDGEDMSIAQSGLLRVLTERIGELPGEDQSELVEQGRRALAAGEAARMTGNRLQAHYQLGLLTAGREALQHFESCLAAAGQAATQRGYCQGGLARHLVEVEPERAKELIAEAMGAIRAGVETDEPWFSTLFWGDRMRVSWRTESHAQAISDSWAALDAVEKLRNAQGPEGRAGLFSTWSDDYYWFSGSLLARTNPSPDDIAQAFKVTEHLRARTVREKFAGVRPELPSKEMLTKRLLGVNAAIENVKRRVNDAQLSIREQKNAQEDLSALTSQRGEVERQRKLRAPTEPETHFAALDEVYQALAPDEALLSFQVAPWKDWTGAFGGGSWLTVVTRGGTRVYALSGREELRHLVERLKLDETGPEETAALIKLDQELLAPALKDLPANVRRLVILPDDDLHKLPFAALRPAAEGPPLIARYQITVAPSARLWLHWRGAPPPPAALPALVLADPIHLDEHLPRLPRSAQEGQDVLDALGGGTLRLQDKASEAFLKKVDLSLYRILHLATHSVVDAENPEHSSIRLTPSPEGKGHFEVADILALEKHGMDGKVVVLSTCESAGGQILRGEGVMSLGRAFFQARAHTVVASLWPVYDRDGMELFERFYRYIGQGASVAAALRAAQRDRIADGAPAQAWAAFVVLGDGDLVPLPGGRWQAWLPAWLSAWRLASAGVALSALLGFGLWWRRRPPFPS